MGKKKVAPANLVAENDDSDYTPQELLTAAALEYKKLEAANQSSIERLYGALSSPFKVANKPCEVSRGEVLRCFEEIIGTRSGGQDDNVGGSGDLAESTVSLGSNGNGSNNGVSVTSKLGFPPVHRCYDMVLQYETCVLDKLLVQHHGQLASFEARRLQEAELVKEPEMASKKKNAQKQLTADDMRRLGMTEEDIARIIAERGKSAEERRQEQDAAEARRREAEQRQKRLKEVSRMKEELVRAEGEPRVAIRDEEEAAWTQLKTVLTAEKMQRLRECTERMMHQRAIEARRKREAEFAAYQMSLEHLTPEEREAFIAEQIATEQARCEAELQAKEREERQNERRLERKLAARKAKQQQRRQHDSDEDDDNSKTTGGGGGGRVRATVVDELEDALLSKLE